MSAPAEQWTDHPNDGRPYRAFLEIAAALGLDRQAVYARAVEIAERTPDEVVPLGALYLRVLAEAIEQPSGAATERRGDGDRWESAYAAVNERLNPAADGFVLPEALQHLSNRERQAALSLGWQTMWEAFRAAGLNPPPIPPSVAWQPTPTPDHRTEVADLRAALAARADREWVVIYDPRMDRRLWLDHVNPEPGHTELVGVWR